MNVYIYIFTSIYIKKFNDKIVIKAIKTHSTIKEKSGKFLEIKH